MPTTRTLTNTGAPLHSPEGDLLGGVQIHFQLMDMGGRPSDAWDAISNERVGGETVIATTDAAGEFSVELWPNTRGNRETKYKCRVQFEGFREFSGVIEDVPGDLQWAAFMLAGSSMEPQDMSAVAAAITSHINAADPHTQYAKESDLGNAAGLDVGTTAGTVAAGDDARLSDARPASDVSAWAKAAAKPTYAKSEVGLGNVDNTSDANKPVSTATQAALDAKVDKVAGKGLSTEDYTTAEKDKLYGIAAGATANATDDQLRDRATHTGSQAISTVAGLQGALDAVNAAKLDKTARGAANGVASLDASGKVPASELPAIAITDVFTVASQAAMLALTAERGDLAVRSDLNKSFALAAEPASTLANWVELRTPTDAVLSVAGKTGAVTLAKGDVGLANVDNTSDANKPISTATQDALNSKEGAIASGATSQFWRGDKTWRDFFTDVRAATLTGLSTATNAAVAAADTMLAAVGKLQAQVSEKVSKSGDTMTGALTLVNQTVPLTANNLPTLCPTLILDFANSRYVDPRITFNRASTATRTNGKGLIETVAANVPRLDFDPVTLACKGLLIEESRTNILAYSEQFDHASWTKANSSISANAITAPDGSLTADKLVESASTGSHRAYRTTAGTTNTSAYTASVSAQAGERSRIYLAQIEGQTFSRQGNTVLDLSSGAIVSASMGLNGATGGAATITKAGNGWYRCAYTLIAGGTDTSLLYDIITVNGVSPNYAGDGTSGIYTWGAQLEAGAFATSYIPTTAAAATRAADVAEMTASNFSSWYRQDEGAFLVFARRDSLSAGRLITLSDGTASNQIRINIAMSSTSLRADLEVVTGGVSQVSTTTTPVFAVGSLVAIAFAYKANDFAISVNGTTVVTDTSGTVPTVDRMHIGTDQSGASSHNGTVARINYYPKRPTNLELQALTAQ